MTPEQMHDDASRHGGCYLLPRRFGRKDPEKDALYAVAEQLIASGHAYWAIGRAAPGIVLTEKPLVDQQSKDR